MLLEQDQIKGHMNAVCSPSYDQMLSSANIPKAGPISDAEHGRPGYELHEFSMLLGVVTALQAQGCSKG